MSAVRPRRSRAARARAGFTLVELMISLVISSILVGMILSIFTRMSTAYRTQQHVAELQQVLVSAHELVQRDLRQAGFGMPDGFQKSGFAANTYHWPVKIIDNGSGFGPDELYLYYADPTAQARVLSFTSSTEFVVDAVDRFDPTDLVVLTNHEMADAPADQSLSPVPPDQPVARYRACVGKLTSITGTTFRLIATGDWGAAGNTQCDFVRNVHGTAAGATTMIYRFTARGYRIDPTRRDLAILQMSPSGGVVPQDWQDLGIGFTDLQVASRWYEGEADSPDWSGANPKYADTPDLDTDVQRDWYSGPSQTLQTDAEVGNSQPTRYRPLMTEVRVSLVVRTTRAIDTVGTGQTPVLTDPARPNNNDTGNRAAVTLAGVADAARPEELRGDHIYRYATVGSDLRNMAVTR